MCQLWQSIDELRMLSSTATPYLLRGFTVGGATPRRNHARQGLGASAAQPADWPRLAAAWDSLRHDLALRAASEQPAGRRLSHIVVGIGATLFPVIFGPYFADVAVTSGNYISG